MFAAVLRDLRRLPSTGFVFESRETAEDGLFPFMIRSLAARNVLSVVLLIVAIVGIIVQVRDVHQGIVLPQTRFVIVGYAVIIVYAIASIAVRVNSMRRPR